MYKLLVDAGHRAAEVVVRVDNEADALRDAASYFNEQQSFLGISVHEGTAVHFMEISDHELSHLTHPALEPLAQLVTLTAFHEHNPGPHPSFYDDPANLSRTTTI